MFDQLEKLIKPDAESQKRFLTWKNNYSDEKKKKEAKLLNRARRQAVILALITLVSISFLLYAVIVKMHAGRTIAGLESQINQLELKLSDCYQ